MTKVQANANALTAMADELGDLERELAPIKAKISRAETLRKALRAAFNESPAAECFEISGARWRYLIGPRGNESLVNVAVLHKLVGVHKLISVAQVSIKALEENFGAEVLGAVVTTKQTGLRSLQPLPVEKKAKRAPAA